VKAKKIGKRNGKQRYECKICEKKFQLKTRPKKGLECLWKEYAEGKQTQQQIATKNNVSRKWINNQLQKKGGLDNKNVGIKPQKIVLIVDTTYFEQFGLMVFRSSNLRKNLLWYEVTHETNDLYRQGIQELLDDGWDVLGLVADGKPGIRALFPDIPFQKCQFHQCKTITTYISKKPKLEAGKELREIMLNLAHTDKASFEYWLKEWHERWKEFLEEKTINPITGKKYFTHRRLRQAYYSFQRNLENLFTFQFHSQIIEIPNTTNSLDGYFSHLKSKLAVHRGASKTTQIKLISEIVFL
jgi:hypothetical protein